MKKTILLTAALLPASCSPFSTPVSELGVEDFAARRAAEAGKKP